MVMRGISTLFAWLRELLTDNESFPIYPLTYDEWEQLAEPMAEQLPHADELGLELTNTGWAVSARSSAIN